MTLCPHICDVDVGRLGPIFCAGVVWKCCRHFLTCNIVLQQKEPPCMPNAGSAQAVVALGGPHNVLSLWGSSTCTSPACGFAAPQILSEVKGCQELCSSITVTPKPTQNTDVLPCIHPHCWGGIVIYCSAAPSCCRLLCEGFTA